MNYILLCWLIFSFISYFSTPFTQFACVDQEKKKMSSKFRINSLSLVVFFICFFFFSFSFTCDSAFLLFCVRFVARTTGHWSNFVTVCLLCVPSRWFKWNGIRWITIYYIVFFLYVNVRQSASIWDVIWKWIALTVRFAVIGSNSEPVSLLELRLCSAYTGLYVGMCTVQRIERDRERESKTGRDRATNMLFGRHTSNSTGKCVFVLLHSIVRCVWVGIALLTVPRKPRRGQWTSYCCCCCTVRAHTPIYTAKIYR